MDAHRPQLHHGGYRQLTNLAELCHDIHASFAGQSQRQRVRFTCDVPHTGSHWIPTQSIRNILDSWVRDALGSMPDGGELDLVVVETHQGLEIEVADTRDDTGNVRDEKAYSIANGSDAVGSAANAPDVVRIETMPCPQGGVARTLIVPIGNVPANSAGSWRKVA